MRQRDNLELRFIGKDEPQLHQLLFSHRSLEAPISGIRGKETPLGLDAVSFQWSSGLRALSLFLVNAVLNEKITEDRPVLLEGIEGSPAATLDYALARQSNWLIDLFGCDSHGISLARKFVSRVNPERKRPGPVQILLQKSFLAPSAIHIVWDGILCEDREQLILLANLLGKIWNSSTARAARSRAAVVPDSPKPSEKLFYPRPFDLPENRLLLEDIFSQELSMVLWRGANFHEKGLQRQIERVFQDPLFVHHAGQREKFVAPMLKRKGNLERLGLRRRAFQSELACDSGKRIKVRLPGGYVAGIALFRYLADVQGYPIDLNYHYLHAGEVLDAYRRDEASLSHSVAIVGDGHLANYFSGNPSPEFGGLMLMPELSFQIVSTGKRPAYDELNGGCYHLLGGGMSSSSLYFQRLLEAGRLKKGRISTVEASPDEIAATFAGMNPDVRAVQWFPYYKLQAVFQGCSLLVPQEDDARFRPNIMLGHPEFLNSPRRSVFEEIVRDAWLTLVESPEALKAVVHLLASDSDYLRFLARSSGFHYLQPSSILPQLSSYQNQELQLQA